MTGKAVAHNVRPDERRDERREMGTGERILRLRCASLRMTGKAVAHNVRPDERRDERREMGTGERILRLRCASLRMTGEAVAHGVRRYTVRRSFSSNSSK